MFLAFFWLCLQVQKKAGKKDQRFLLANWLEVLPYKWVERSEQMKPSFDSVMAMMRELSVEEQLVLVDSDNRPAIKQFLLSLQSLLTPAGTIKVRPAEKFSPHEFFKVNTKQNASMKISYVGDNFTAWFLGKVEERPSASEAAPGDGPDRTPGVQNNNIEIALRYQTLNRGSVDGPIIAELGGEAKAETTLAEIAACMHKQANGEQGALLIDGYANIFYVRNVNGVLCAVVVHWYGDGWGVSAYSVGFPGAWAAGYRVFSRDS